MVNFVAFRLGKKLTSVYGRISSGRSVSKNSGAAHDDDDDDDE